MSSSLRLLSFHPDAILYIAKPKILRTPRRPLVARYPAARCTALCKSILPCVSSILIPFLHRQSRDANFGYPQSSIHPVPVPAQMMQHTDTNVQMASMGEKPRQQMDPQAFQQPQFQPQVFYTSTPVAALGPGAAPTDCPACRRRAITRINHVSGCTTQYVAAAIQYSGPRC